MNKFNYLKKTYVIYVHIWKDELNYGIKHTIGCIISKI